MRERERERDSYDNLSYIQIYIHIYIYIWETRVQSEVTSYQRHKKWYLIPPCLTLSYIKYISRVKWSNPGKGVVPSSTPQCSCY